MRGHLVACGASLELAPADPLMQSADSLMQSMMICTSPASADDDVLRTSSSADIMRSLALAGRRAEPSVVSASTISFVTGAMVLMVVGCLVLGNTSYAALNPTASCTVQAFTAGEKREMIKFEENITSEHTDWEAKKDLMHAWVQRTQGFKEPRFRPPPTLQYLQCVLGAA